MNTDTLKNRINQIISQSVIDTFCKKHHIQKLSLFGSILRADFNKDSDIDVLVEFNPEHIPGLISLTKMELELSSILKRQVDLLTSEDLSKYFRQEVLDLALVQYVSKK
ncbi:nucleotidyltransferase domain protein [Cyanobacterium sp. HL-69]|uniref:nucleotidyltransferase family protein n=1 Tax=Cyanobacterium sp. HL-69 TaxID=2054282 RepID=UPI000CA14468|nr:nucleotidyltransferase domain protein [Cyanobacterium sp. HL-69]